MVDPRAKRVTARDVAALAGVSPGTVSKALNGTWPVSEQTRTRILAAAAEIDFRPNARARSVFEGRSYTIGLITTDSFERFSVPVMLGAEDALGAGRMSVFLCDSRDDPIREKHYVDVLLDRRVDGIIVTGRASNTRLPLEVGASVPVVYALTPSSNPDDCSIIVDDVGAGWLAGEHLIRLGRQRIAYITGPEWFDASRQRRRGLEEALARTGLDLVVDPLYGSWTEAWGRQAANMLLRTAPEVDAIYCGSDLLARGVSSSLREAGRRVPQDVALIGTDNWEFMVTGARPPLTSVDLGLVAVGRLAGERLLAAIAGQPHHGRELVPPHLVVRTSTDDVRGVDG